MSIHNPSIFSGEQSFGTTAGAPLSTDANNKLVSGISNTEVSGTTSVTGTAAADVLLTGMTITPVAGTYLVIFSSDLNATVAGVVASFSIYVGGVQKADSQRKINPLDGGLGSSGSSRGAVAINGVVTVNGAQAIEIRWSLSAVGATTGARTMNIARVA